MQRKNITTTEVASSPVVAPKAKAAAVKPAVGKVAKPRAKSTVSTHKTRTPSAFAPVDLTVQQIADMAYFIWLDRGCPVGNPEEDWFRAESALRVKTAAA